MEPDIPKDAQYAPDPDPAPRRGRVLRDPKLSRPPQRYLVNVTLSDVPTTYEDATDFKQWRQATAVELDAHRRDNPKQDLAHLQKGRKYESTVKWGDFGSRGDFGHFSQKRLKLL